MYTDTALLLANALLCTLLVGTLITLYNSSICPSSLLPGKQTLFFVLGTLIAVVLLYGLACLMDWMRVGSEDVLILSLSNDSIEDLEIAAEESEEESESESDSDADSDPDSAPDSESEPSSAPSSQSSLNSESAGTSDSESSSSSSSSSDSSAPSSTPSEGISPPQPNFKRTNSYFSSSSTKTSRRAAKTMAEIQEWADGIKFAVMERAEDIKENLKKDNQRRRRAVRERVRRRIGDVKEVFAECEGRLLKAYRRS